MPDMMHTSRWARALTALVLTFATQSLPAQWQSSTGPAGATLGATVGGDVERYVRALTMNGIIRPLPWAVRPFGPDDLSSFLRDSARAAHPWRAALGAAKPQRNAVGAMLYAGANSGFPWGSNDGAMWQGRGVTSAIGLAASFRWGPLRAVAAPVLYWAGNTAFPLMVQPAFGYSKFSDPLFPTNIDLPQRMGDRPYARGDGGESTVRLQGRGLTVGITTASLGWGTGESFPAMFGANAGGFPHLFAGSSGGGLRVPLLGRVSARYVLGQLGQSAWSPVQGSETYINAQQSGTRRIGTGLNVSFMPALLPQLELGASRFYHSPYRDGPSRWDAWSKPFEGIFKKDFENRSGGTGDPTGDADNQMASFFARWLFPARGIEASFELFREDHNWDSRDLAQEPENNSAILASVRATTRKRADDLSVLSFEFFDGDVRPTAQQRPQGFLYTHGGLLQGHTQRGQLLGSPLGAGAITGQRIAWERFTPKGSQRMQLQRWRTRALRTQNPEGLYLAANYQLPNSLDYIIDGSVVTTRYHGQRALSIEAGLAWAGRWQLDRRNQNFYARASWSVF